MNTIVKDRIRNLETTMEMDEDHQYGNMMDRITRYMDGTPVLPAIPQPPRDLHYAMSMLGGYGGGGSSGGGVSFGSDSMTGMLSSASGVSGDSTGGSGSGSGLCMEIGGRWSKEETLALLDIRSRLDYQFKKANHKGPLWEEVSRIMYVEFGYKRTGKQCSVKFENLYKYYKKIKEGKIGKAGRQDKKHYRFFHQLEAIYGETSSTSTNFDHPNKVSVTNANFPPFMEENDQTYNKRSMMGKKHWKTAITDFIETKMNTLMEKQEKWMEKVMNTIEEKEKERLSKEEQRRKEHAARLEMVKDFRSNELAWMQSRDSSIMEALHKLARNDSVAETSRSAYYNDQNQVANDWGENEITQLIQLRSSMEARFEEGGFMESVLWEEIALTMAGLGYNRSALICKAKWDHINFLLRNKKQKGNSNVYSDHHNHMFHQAGERFMALNAQQNDCGDGVLMSDPGIMWNYNGNI